MTSYNLIDFEIQMEDKKVLFLNGRATSVAPKTNEVETSRPKSYKDLITFVGDLLEKNDKIQ